MTALPDFDGPIAYRPDDDADHPDGWRYTGLIGETALCRRAEHTLAHGPPLGGDLSGRPRSRRKDARRKPRGSRQIGDSGGRLERRPWDAPSAPPMKPSNSPNVSCLRQVVALTTI